MSNQKNKRKSSLNDKIYIVLGIIFVLIIFAGIVILVNNWEQSNNIINPDAGKRVTADTKIDEEEFEGSLYRKKKSVETTLVLGIDKFSEGKKTEADEYEVRTSDFEQADVLMLIVSDKINNTYSILQLNRDSMTDINILTTKGAFVNSFVGQLALAHTYGGNAFIRCRNTMDAVTSLLGDIKIDHYISITMDSIPVLNDLVDGVTLEVMDDIDETMKAGQTVTLDGDMALRYIRARMGLDNPTNLHRMERQKQYMLAFIDKFVEKYNSNSSFTYSALVEISDYLESDCNINQLSSLINTLISFERTSFFSLEGDNVEGEEFIEFYPYESSINKALKTLYWDKVD